MTELISSKPVVKLPKKRQTILFDNGRNGGVGSVSGVGGNTNGYAPVAKQPDYFVVVSDKLYTDPRAVATAGVSEYDILEHLRSCEPIEFNPTTGMIRFSSIERADRAHTLFNDTKVKDVAGNGYKLQLRVNPPFQQHSQDEPEAISDFLQIRNLPLQTTTNHHLYSIFRPFGPMSVCKVIIEHGHFKGTALVQYYRSCDADAACAEMNNKTIQGNMITVGPFVPKKLRPQSGDSDAPQPPQQPSTPSISQYHRHSMQYPSPTPRGPLVAQEKSNVDYTNLYIKNLDLSVESSDLFTHFNDCGHIVSARVMKDTQTKQSKGFGFVSFSKTEEASRALHEKNNTHIKSKPIIVAFHEPKKPRQGKQQLHQQQPPQYRSHDLVRRFSQPGSIPPHPPPPYMPVAPPITEYVPYAAPPPPVTSAPPPPPSSNSNSIYHRQQPQQQPPPLPQQQQQHNHYQNNKSPSLPVNNSNNNKPYRQLSSLASGTYIQPPQQQQHQTTPQPTFRRRGSAESMSSIMTETTSNVQKQRLAKAVYKCGEQHQVNDIVEMLLTLTCKERSLCLFNPDILREKIDLAKTALEIFKEEDDDNDEVHLQSLPKKEQQQQQHYHQQINNTNHNIKSSRAIPIVAPPPPPAQPIPSSGAGEVAGRRQEEEDMDVFLASLEGLSIYEQKQRLGDRLFPCVKATGVKYAPRVTIRLLDTVPLRDLAHSMHNTAVLKQKVDVVVAAMQQ